MALGDPLEIRGTTLPDAATVVKGAKKDSAFAVGRLDPNPCDTVTLDSGVVCPIGEPRDRVAAEEEETARSTAEEAEKKEKKAKKAKTQASFLPGPSQVVAPPQQPPCMGHNEFITYDECQSVMRYLVRIRIGEEEC